MHACSRLHACTNSHACNQPNKRRKIGKSGEHENNESASQFFFSQESINDILNLISTFNLSNTAILCVGCPTIYAKLKATTRSVYLLDLDERLKDATPYNMFTDFFVRDEKMIRSLNVGLIICDPPFQPKLLPALLRSLKSLAGGNEGCVQMLVLPYFFQKDLEGMLCVDMRISYANHKKYKTAGNSPVRLFVRGGCVNKPFSDEYEFCGVCEAVKHKTLTRHCEDCGICVSVKNPSFKHCNDCGVCVKMRMKHCGDCGVCHGDGCTPKEDSRA
jgi:hypothetical protein